MKTNKNHVLTIILSIVLMCTAIIPTPAMAWSLFGSPSSKLYKELDRVARRTTIDEVYREFNGACFQEREIDYGSFMRSTLLKVSIHKIPFLSAKLNFDRGSRKMISISMAVKQEDIESEIQQMLKDGVLVKCSDGRYTCMPDDGAYTITLEPFYQIILLDKVYYYQVNITY